PPDAHSRAGPASEGLPHGAPDRHASRGPSPKAAAFPPPVLPDRRVGLPFGPARHRDSVLSRGSRAREYREAHERPREPARDPDVSPSRGGTRVQLRVSALPATGVA